MKEERPISHRVKHEVAIETAEKIKQKLIREAVKTYLRSDPRKLGGRTLFHNSIKAIKKGES
tara:strand:+ start:376 stop:561 length:186 start_codon:yes stop_codon:yes gene_type:complete